MFDVCEIFPSFFKSLLIHKGQGLSLVKASDLRDAVKKLDEGMKGSMIDYVIASVAETPIMDVYPFKAKAE